MFHDHNNFKDFPVFNNSHSDAKSFRQARDGIFDWGCLVIICNIVIITLIIIGLVTGFNYVKKHGLRDIGNTLMNGQGTNTVETTN